MVPHFSGNAWEHLYTPRQHLARRNALSVRDQCVGVLAVTQARCCSSCMRQQQPACGQRAERCRLISYVSVPLAGNLEIAMRL